MTNYNDLNCMVVTLMQHKFKSKGLSLISSAFFFFFFFMRQHPMFLTDFHSLQQRAAEAHKDSDEISPDFLV